MPLAAMAKRPVIEQVEVDEPHVQEQPRGPGDVSSLTLPFIPAFPWIAPPRPPPGTIVPASVTISCPQRG